MAVERDHWQEAADPEPSRQLARELALAGVELQLPVDAEGRVAGGAALPVDGAAVECNDAVGLRVADMALDILQSGVPLTASLMRMAAGDKREDGFRRFCELLAGVRCLAGTCPGSIGICLDGTALPPHTAWATRRQVLGDGPLYLMAGRALLRPGRQADARDGRSRFWIQLWQLRSKTALRVAYGSAVLSHCPLLAPEDAAGVVPSGAIQGPAGSAWTAMRLDLCRFADGRGNIDEAALERALCCCVEVGDRLHDRVVWPTACMRHDAWLNRRLGILIDGIGELAARRRLDPSRFGCLASLGDVLRHARRILRERSAAVAAAAGSVPVLASSDPAATLPGGDLRDGWARRWRDAARASATRHRNLIVMSPWSVFPSRAHADLRYADLLPLLRFADACAFPGSPGLARWNVNEFKAFHQRAWAVLEQREATESIAERP